jgi:GTP cyclohydrolase FolE2
MTDKYLVRLTPNTICMFVFLEQLRKGVDMFRLPAELEKTIRE